MSQTFYLKYRPQTFADLDSTDAREELIKTFSSGKVPHAFLFTGTKGIGKTSAARIVAKAVNCLSIVQSSKCNPSTSLRLRSGQALRTGVQSEGGKLLEYEPCNKCSPCISITSGTNVDVMEIDAASFTGVDDIRELRDKIKLAPASLKYKVFIIDEVHRLSGSAFDALLKTLEEPPQHAIFVLCTTEPQKLPKTIISRCQEIHFKKATKKEIIERLKKNCKKEELEYEEVALAQIVKLSEGSFRDAVKLLEQVSYGGKISADAVNRMSGISVDFLPADFLALLADGSAKEALVWIDKAVESGISLKVLIESLLEELRLLLLAQFGIEAGVTPEIKLNPSDIKILIDLLNKAYNDMRFSVIPQLPLEMAVVEWSSFATPIRRASEDKSSFAKGGGGKREDMSNKPNETNKTNETSEPNKITASFSLEEVISKWPLILEAVKPLNHSVLAFLKACRPKTVEDKFLVLEVFYKFHKDQLESDKCRRIVEKAASAVMNNDILVKCVLSSEKPIKSEPAPLPSMKPASAKESASAKSNLATADKDDIIKVAEEIFNK